MKSRHCSILRGPSISTTTWCRRRRCGPRATTRSRRSRSSSASSGGIGTHLAQRRSNGLISGSGQETRPSDSGSSTTTRMIVLLRGSWWMGSRDSGEARGLGSDALVYLKSDGFGHGQHDQREGFLNRQQSVRSQSDISGGHSSRPLL
jgi:hypothetical protein